MKKSTLELFIFFCVLVEVFFIYHIFISTSTIYKELYTGLAIIVLLSMIRLIHNLTAIIYGDHEKN